MGERPSQKWATVTERRGPVTVAIGPWILGYGPDPRRAFRCFTRNVWRCALAAAEHRRGTGELERECIAYLAEVDPINWHRALKARGLR